MQSQIFCLKVCINFFIYFIFSLYIFNIKIALTFCTIILLAIIGSHLNVLKNFVEHFPLIIITLYLPVFVLVRCSAREKELSLEHAQ